MSYFTVKGFNKLIEETRQSFIGDEQLDSVMVKLAELLEMLRDNQAAIVSDLIAMYEAASEHNIDIDREAVFKLAEQLLGEE
jgi:hypothetical protein